MTTEPYTPLTCGYPQFNPTVDHCTKTAMYLVSGSSPEDKSGYEPYCHIHMASVVANAAKLEARRRHPGYRNPVLVIQVDGRP